MEDISNYLKYMRNYSATMCVDSPIRLKAMQARVISTQPLAGMGLLDGTSQGIVEPLDLLFKEYGLITSTSVVRKVRGRILIYIMNPNTYDLILPKDTPVATFQPITEVVKEGSFHVLTPLLKFGLAIRTAAAMKRQEPVPIREQIVGYTLSMK